MPIFDSIQALEIITKQDSGMNMGTRRNIEFQKQASILASLGLLKTVATLEGVSYEITEAGYRFLKEYQDIDRDTSRRVLDQLIKDKVSVIIPAMNEVKSIGEIVTSIPFGWEIILVDLSTDGTAQKAMSLRPDVRIIRRGPREVGKGAALRLGLRKARGKIVVMMDGDGSHQTCELLKLVTTLEAQNADLVQASRMLQQNGSEEMAPYKNSVRYFGNKIVTSLINTLFHSSITDSQYGLRAVRKEFISKLSLRSNDWDIETEIVARAARCRGKIVEVPSFELQRKNGESHLGVLEYAIVVTRRLLVEIFRR
jgi:glycosyltransferase involved in cell wall biosynthesis/predicted transcriptional regulator